MPVSGTSNVQIARDPEWVLTRPLFKNPGVAAPDQVPISLKRVCLTSSTSTLTRVPLVAAVAVPVRIPSFVSTGPKTVVPLPVQMVEEGGGPGLPGAVQKANGRNTAWADEPNAAKIAKARTQMVFNGVADRRR